MKPSSESTGGECQRRYGFALSLVVAFLVRALESPFQTTLEAADLSSKACSFLNEKVLSHTRYCLVPSDLWGSLYVSIFTDMDGFVTSEMVCSWAGGRALCPTASIPYLTQTS